MGRKYKAEFEKLSLTIGNLKSKHSRELEIFESEVDPEDDQPLLTKFLKTGV